MYNVFTDFHHSSLLNSLIILFEKRFNGNVYRPIGTEWHELGYWKIYNHPETIQQFLGIGGATPDGTRELNEVASTTPEADPIYNCYDIDSDQTNKAITHSRFMNEQIDLVVASIPDHIEPFRRLCDSHPSKPKLIYQIGNAWNIGDDLEKHVDGIMASARLNRAPTVPFIEYHQEFDIDIFKPQNLSPIRKVGSFVNCFNVDALFVDDWHLFTACEKLVPQWKFEAFGGQCRDGAAHGSKQLSQFMNESEFIWHTKNGGDGYGHVIHNAAAVGKPIICKLEYYRGKLAEKLLRDGETAVVIDGLNAQEIINKIEYFSERIRYNEMCKITAINFNIVVDFDAEALNIKNWLENILT